MKSPRVPAGRERVRYLHAGEFRALLEPCPEWLRHIVGLAVATGMRRGEILGLRWLDVDLRGERIMLPQTKNGEGRANRGFPLPRPLRHTAASWLRMQGADINTVAQLLGHEDLRMAARYQHLSPASLADAVKRLDQVFGESVALAA